MTPPFHPATLLLVWVACILLIQPLETVGLVLVACFVLPWALLWTGASMRILLRRTRWLLLTIALLFGFATPGERLPGAVGDIGITWDGLKLGVDHVLRLVLLLASLALLHRRLGNHGVMTGLHWLLTPLSGWRDLRQRLVVRLMLVLDYVEAPSSGNWRAWLEAADAPGTESLRLVTAPLLVRDRLFMLLAVVVPAVVLFGR